MSTISPETCCLVTTQKMYQVLGLMLNDTIESNHSVNIWLVVSIPLKKPVNWDDNSQYMGKEKMFQTTNQIILWMIDIIMQLKVTSWYDCRVSLICIYIYCIICVRVITFWMIYYQTLNSEDWYEQFIIYNITNIIDWLSHNHRQWSLDIISYYCYDLIWCVVIIFLVNMVFQSASIWECTSSKWVYTIDK